MCWSFAHKLQLWAYPETTPKEVRRGRRKASRVGISFKLLYNMKKIFLLLALAFTTNLAFANNGEPVKDTEDKSATQLKTIVLQAGQSDEAALCTYCAKCVTTVCIFCTCGNCEAQWAFLWEAMCNQGCCGGVE